MRKIIAQVTKNTPALQAVVGRRIHASSSLGHGNVPAKPKFPFILYREFEEIPFNIAKDTAPDVVRRVFQFYVHDERGTYQRINNIISILRETVRGMTDEVSSDGARCLDATWSGTSGDTEDPTYDSNMKYVTFSFVSTK